MKPIDLKCPYSWKNRCVAIHDRVWYVPDYYDRYQQFKFPGWQDPSTFSNGQPIKVEYCSGNGAWIAAKAEADPFSNWVAVEKQFLRAQKIWSKIKNQNLANLLVVCGEGYKVTHHYFPSETVQEVYVNFPDPWPKRRHAKHRIIQPSFIQEIQRILVKRGTFTFVTDDRDYSSLMIKEMAGFPEFEPLYSHHFVTENPEYGNSFFEDLWRSQGKEIRYHQYRKRAK